MTIAAASNATSGSRGELPNQRAYYADDDSVVSSNVTNDDDGGGSNDNDSSDGSSNSSSDDRHGTFEPEVARLTQAAETGTRNAINQPQQEESVSRCMCMPRNRKEWCIVLLALLLVVAVGLGTGLGLSMFGSRGGSGDGVSDGNDGDGNDGNATDEPSAPTYAPTGIIGPPVVDPDRPDDPEDLAAAVRYHVVAQGISDGASFLEVGSGSESTPQQRALDFLADRDFLPSVVDDEGDDDDDDPLAVNDDPLALPDDPPRRPYLTTATPAYRVSQRYATTVLYYATDGDDWDINRLWLEPGVHECDWIGVTCEERRVPSVTLTEAVENPEDFPSYDDVSAGTTVERMVVAIDLPENNVAGTLPQELVALPLLGRLGLWNNRIGGSLPKQLGQLTRLFSLLLDGNSLAGKIPGQLGQMQELKDLFLARNRGIGGRIPSSLGNLSKLERLRLSDMSLRGSIPSALGKLTNLFDLSLHNNRLTQSLPDEMDALIYLSSLTLNGNQLTGSIPDSWSTLSQLKKLEVHSNNMAFEVEEWLCATRTTAPEGGGMLQTLTTDCQGEDPTVSCRCCTNCPAASGL